MSVIPNSINVSTQIAPNFTEDTFALFDPIYGIGGLREVANLTERNNISAERLRVGMLVYVTSENQFYRLVSFSENQTPPYDILTNWENVIFLNNSGQTISGVKTFTSRPTVNGTGVLLSGEAAVLPATIVYASGNQIISGFKTFTSRPTVNGSGVLLSGEVAIVYTTGDQTISGVKTFDKVPVVSGNQLITGDLSLYVKAIDLLTSTNELVDVITGNYVTKFNGQFTNRPNVNGTGILLSGELPSAIVHTTGNQIISGFKTFAAAGNYIIISGTSDAEGLIKSLSSNLTIEGANSNYGIQFSDEATFIHGYTEINNNLSAQTGTFQQLYADNLVYNTGNQSISGNKTFASRPKVNGIGVLLSGEAAALPATIVYTTGDQNISGIKTFATHPTVNGTGVLLSGEATIVYTTGNQSISGVKTFATRPTVNGTGVLLSGETTVLPATIVLTTGDQSISGVKTFSQQIYIASGNGVVGGIYGTNNPDSDSHLKIVGYSTNGEESWVDIEAAGNSISVGEGAIIIKNNNGGLIFNGSDNIYIDGTRNLSAENTTASFKNVSVNNLLNITHTGQQIGYISGESFDNGDQSNLYIKTNADGSVEQRLILESEGVRLTLGRDAGLNYAGSQGNQFLIDGNGENLLVQNADVYVEQNAYASNLVYNNGDQTISGNKNFVENVVFGDQNQSDLLVISGENINFGTLPTVNGTGILLRGEPTIVYTTGNQTINGNKFFLNDITINNLTVTGTRTITNTQESNIQSNYLLLNITGGATNGGIYFVTGAGFSGINSVGPIIAYDNNDNSFKIGTGIRSASINSLKTIATTESVVNLTSDQTINGVKTFATRPTVNGTGVLLSGETTVLPATIVYATGDQSISGVKTFVAGNVNFSGSTTQYIGLGKTTNSLDIGTKILIHTGDYGLTYIGRGGNTPIPYSYGIVFEGGQFTTKKGYLTAGANVYATGYQYASLDWTSRILSGNWKTDKNIRVGDAYPVLTTGNQDISGIKTFSNGSNQILNTTYSELTGLKATSSLLSGQLYRISDFVLKWNNQSINDQTVKTAVSGEPLIVAALSNKEIYHIAQSETYPQDTIYYNINASGSYSWGTINNNASISDFKGWIYRRVDNLLDIDIPYDWRNITVNCCKPDVSSVPNYSGNYSYTRSDYVKETGNNSNRGKLYYSVATGNSGNNLNNTNFWNPVSSFVESGTFFSTDEANTFVALYDDVNLGDWRINLPFLTTSRIQQPTFTSTLTGLGAFTLSNVKNIKIEGGYSNVIIGDSFQNNTIGNNFYLNTIGLNFYNNTIENTFVYNNIGATFYGNTIGEGFSSNTIGNSFQINNIGISFNANTIGESFFANTMGYAFSSNTIGSSFVYNNIGNIFTANTIGNSFNVNTVANNFNLNTVGTTFNSNTIGNIFQNNNIANSFAYNTIGNVFEGNTVGTTFNLNTIGNIFQSNNIQTSFGYNTIANFFNSNTIGNNFLYNTIGNVFEGNTVGNSFNNNISENSFDSINFSTSTHVYNGYNTTLFKNSAGTQRLRYFNSSDQLVVTDPTA